MWTTEDDQLRVRTIEILGIYSLSHADARAMLIASLSVVVEPRSHGANRRAL